MDWSAPGSSVHGIFQARVLKWSAIAFSVVAKIIIIINTNKPGPSHMALEKGDSSSLFSAHPANGLPWPERGLPQSYPWRQWESRARMLVGGWGHVSWTTVGDTL